MHPYIRLTAIALAFIILNSCKNNSSAPAAGNSAEFEKEIQEKLVNAKEGDVIELPEGTYSLSRPLILDGVKNVTIKGKGVDKTILSFKNQKDGAEGLRITANGIVLQDFTLLDAKGDCIKLEDVMNVTIRKMKVGWTTLHATSNGSYALYPVGCSNVLIEDCEVFGSSDAGVYVGQSKNIIVRRNIVHDNVAGIEIENCIDADVYENQSHDNTGGLLVFDNPDLPVKNGMRCRVHNNKIYDNNTNNFGPKGTSVSEIPAGTGFIIMATNQCEVYSNEITNQNTVSGAVICYLTLKKPYHDTIYDPYCGGIYIHDNNIRRGTGKVDRSVNFGDLLAALFGDKVPDLVYDGAVNPAYKNNDGSIKDDDKICMRNNGNVTFVNLDMANGNKHMSTDMSKMDCTVPSWQDVKIMQ
jgi:parallel beta-helix repeat protein